MVQMETTQAETAQLVVAEAEALEQLLSGIMTSHLVKLLQLPLILLEQK
jgi:hypothetical protein